MTYKPVLNAHQKSKLNKRQPPKPILQYHADNADMKDDPDITSANLERMMQEYFREGGTIKILDDNGNVIRETR